MLLQRNEPIPEPCVFVIFGATGDLSRRKLFPALYNLFREKQLPQELAVVGLGRSIADLEGFRQLVHESVEHFSRKLNGHSTTDYIKSFYYLAFDINDSGGFASLQDLLAEIDGKHGTRGNRVFYLAVTPEQFGPIVGQLHGNGMSETDSGWKRIVVEKPFGHDLASARKLNRELSRAFGEESIYRIDHYLGKSMLQNTIVIRFANAVFEPLWNNHFIDNIQIIINETDGVGHRGRYYEQAGALRDMVQNHLMQLLAFVAMEPPTDLKAESIRDEKTKVIRSLLPLTGDAVLENVVRGQYASGEIDHKEVVAYRDEKWVAPDSIIETFVALKLFVNNWRWAGVPFYLRTGKRMPAKSARIVVQFKPVPGIPYFEEPASRKPNTLVIKVQPEEGVFLQFSVKELGSSSNIVPATMDYCQNCRCPQNSPEAYERLLRDVIAGDATLFTRWDEVEATWMFVEPIMRAWQDHPPRFPNYAAGSWGPPEADLLLKNDLREWWLTDDEALRHIDDNIAANACVQE